MLRNEPVELWPALERDNLPTGILRKSFEASIGGEGQVDAATAQQKTNLLGASITASQRDLEPKYKFGKKKCPYFGSMTQHQG